MATSSIQASRTISSLPQELKDLISDECDLADLPTLRLIDRGFNTSGKETLGKRLTELEKITADPDLAKYIQKIVLVSQRYTEPGEDDSVEYGSVEHKTFLNNLAACRSVFNTKLPSRNAGAGFLQLIFRNLNRAQELHPTCCSGNIVFSVSQEYGCEDSPHLWGLDKYLAQIRATGLYIDNLALNEYNDPSEILLAVLEASMTEHSPIQELDARYHAAVTHSEEEPGLGFHFECDPTARLQPAWAALKSLKLDFGRETVYWREDSCWLEDSWTHFQSFINAAPNLEKVSIGSTGEQSKFDDYTLGRMDQFLKDSKITSLELGPLWTTSKCLLHFLAPRRHTLQTLKFHRVGLSGREESARDSWRNVLRHLATKFRLRKVEVFQIWTGKEYQQPYDDDATELRTQQFVDQGSSAHPFVCEGSAEVKSELGMLASNAVHLRVIRWCEGDWPYTFWHWRNNSLLSGGSPERPYA
ncbi:hypothetical protein LTR56_016965 [Elasticomyces elasticus]|nr:hypothetical protein LTR56_016965 [Elasticomyces elasticus]KAK3640459.1 hypothetical protein LTR22_017017 [Elasticomyces elasticus]KAK4931162.1 hypothetical protein LTR49_002215 [Elasticomyces elasticus]KAK5767907.1 hypothetical protein LTS12_002064 [Elasticomyces elasticus]